MGEAFRFKPGEELSAAKNGDRLLTIQQVSELTGLAVGTLYHFASESRIPTTRLSKRCLRFRLSDLTKWIDELTEYPDGMEKEKTWSLKQSAKVSS
jgi:excisionase family DNA binding protein